MALSGKLASSWAYTWRHSTGFASVTCCAPLGRSWTMLLPAPGDHSSTVSAGSNACGSIVCGWYGPGARADTEPVTGCPASPLDAPDGGTPVRAPTEDAGGWS